MAGKTYISKPKAFYINLDHRTERADLMQRRWSQIVDLKRFSAYDLRAKNEPVKGCYMSHLMCMGMINALKCDYALIMEDDIIPCRDFNIRLGLFMKEIPQDWDVFMLGYSVHPSSKYREVGKYFFQADAWVGAGHCYMINPKSFHKIFALSADEKKHENNLDIFLNYLQHNHKVYMANPSFCYQYSSHSDNSNMVVGNTKYTEVYFKECL